MQGGAGGGRSRKQVAMSKVAQHRKNTKTGIDIDEARRKREDNIIELRKSKRDENLQKKRQTFAAPNYATEDSTRAPSSSGQRVRWADIYARDLLLQELPTLPLLLLL
jgi:hypothetical protein